MAILAASIRRALLLSAALFAPTLANARERHHYDCKVEREAALGQLEASSRVSEGGVPQYVSLSWSFPTELSPLSLSASWFGWHGEQPALSSASHFYGRRGQRIRFHLTSAAGEILLRSERLERNRSRFFHYTIPWDTLRSVAARVGVLHIRTVEESGSVISELRVSSDQLEQVDRQAAQLSRDFAAILANYQAECESTRDAIILVH